MQFRLTYAGQLRADTKSAREIANHKQEIRRVFHQQLAHLWDQKPHLRQSQFGHDDEGIVISYGPPSDRLEYLSAQFQRNGYRFVPLVTRDLEVSCRIDILYLRNGPIGGLLRRNDIDNRIKTLFDALKMPEAQQDLGQYTTPAVGEDPFFCLVEDDSLITSLSVETGLLLEPTAAKRDPSDARLLITVTLRPDRVMWRNMAFG